MKTSGKMLSLGLIACLLTVGFWTGKVAEADSDQGNANFTISDVNPHQFSPEQGTPITITGSGFSSGLKVGIADNGSEVTGESELTVLVSSFVDPTQMSATVPAGFTAGEYDLYVYDPSQSSFTYAKKEEALELEVEWQSSTSELNYSNSKAARKKVDVTFDGIVITKKKWAKVRMNRKNVPILKVVRTDANSTTLRLNVKYKGWAPGSYDLVLTYKNKVKQRSVNKKGKTIYHYAWDRGTMTVNNFLTIL